MQEKLITEGPIPYSIVRATKFFEFVTNIADASMDGSMVRVAPVLVNSLGTRHKTPSYLV